MESTSIGLPQIMGFHWTTLKYISVGAMWDDFKVGEYNQVKALANFIKVDTTLHSALANQKWDVVASIYNGKKYAELAKQNGTVPYDIKLAKAFDKNNSIQI